MENSFGSFIKILATGLMLHGAVLAQGFPNKPVRIVVPYAAGGATDVMARAVGGEMALHLGQTVIIENRTGAAGAIGASVVAKAPADGYTLLFGGVGPIIVVPAVDPTLSYNPTRDFEPLGQVTNNEYAWVVNAASPLRNVADFVKLAKSKPASVSYMTTGVGGPLHVSMEYFSKKVGIELIHLPYQGESLAVGDLLSNRIDVAIMSVTIAAPLVNSGKVRLLSVLSEKRSAALPEVPTIAEAGYPEHEVPIWIGLFLPKGTPPAAVAKLADAFDKAMNSEALKKRIREMGAEPVGSSPDTYRAFLARENARWTLMVKETGIKRQ